MALKAPYTRYMLAMYEHDVNLALAAERSTRVTPFTREILP
jgi:hypothetical protein